MNKKIIPLLIISPMILSSCTLFFDSSEEKSSSISSSENESSGSQYEEVTFSIVSANFIDEKGHLKIYYSCNYPSPFNVTGHTFNKLNVTGVTVKELNSATSGYFTILSPIISTSLKFEFYDTNNVVYILERCNDVKLYDGEEEEEETIDYPSGYSTLYWSDEFDSISLNTSNWTYETGNGDWGWGNGESQYYTSNNDFISDGVLTIRAKKETIDSYSYTSTRIKTQNKVHFTYGYVEARIALPAITGMWPAFWMMPNSSIYGTWPNSGEIDIMEAKGRVSNASSSALHFSDTSGSHTYLTNEKSGHNITSYHKYAVEWTSTLINYYIDDVCHLSITNNQWGTYTKKDSDTAPFDQDFYIILNLAVGGQFDGYQMPPDSFSYADMLVDYVRVFKK